MGEGLEVIIKYRGAKYNQVASPISSSSELAILKKDLAHLRVHSPSQKNVRRVNGSFILHWPMAGTSPKVEGLADSLHMRWFKLCSDDPEALKLREFLSIESITLTQDGVLIRSTAGAEAPPGSLAERLNVPLPEIAQQPTPTPIHSLPVKPQPPAPAPPPPKLPPSAPRLDRQPSHMKRRMSVVEDPSSLAVPEAQTTTTLRSIKAQPQPTHLPTSPRAGRRRGSSTPGDATKASPQPAQDEATPLTHSHAPTLPILSEPETIPRSPPREHGERTSHTPLPIPTPVSGRSPLGSGPRPPPHRPTVPNPAPASPYPSSSSSGNGDGHASCRRDRDVSRLTRELWDTRRQLTAMRAREQVILDDLERVGARPESAGSGADRNGVSQDELLRLEAELRAERTRRVRAERALSDVERECRAPFVVPALYQAFIRISELSN
ncbi:hypothetical protein J3R82DRAFT_1697 [Butyriboletus roseoflavus]|nr:hypothetical protein J3R82DRAFT_1697 [Butyriboletus roseoflavus]